MADPGRFRYGEAPTTRRSPPLYNPARASMPVTSVGYNSLYGGDVPVVPSHHLDPHDHHDHEPLARSAEFRRDTIPAASTYSARDRKEPLGRSTSVREDGSRTSRYSAAESSARRPIIVTTKHAPAHPSSATRSGSPSRDPYRSSDEGQFYAQPASSINRGRGSQAPFSSKLDDEEYLRLKDRTEHERLIDPRAEQPVRPSRPTVLYASSTGHRPSAREYEDEGYEYTKPSDLARYDLDRSNKPTRRSRRESLDRYYRPTVSVTTDLNARPYEQNERRQRGPPPTTWGLDKVNARIPAGGIYDGATAPGGIRMPAIPPAVPLAPGLSRRPPSENPGSPERRSASRTRPISLIQDPERPSHHEAYYRPREEEMAPRETRDRERDRERDRDFFQDHSVTSRGFGILVDPAELDDRRRRPEPELRDERRGERLEPRREYEGQDLRKRTSYDDLDIPDRSYEPHDRHVRDRERERDRDYDRAYERDLHRDHDHRDHREFRDPRDHPDRSQARWVDEDLARDRREHKGKEPALPDGEHEGRKERLGTKIATGAGIAAVSALPSILKKKDRPVEDDDDAKASRRRREKEVEEEIPRRRREERVEDDDDVVRRRRDERVEEEVPVVSRRRRDDDVDSRRPRDEREEENPMVSRRRRDEELDPRRPVDDPRSRPVDDPRRPVDDARRTVDDVRYRPDDSRPRPSRKEDLLGDEDFEIVEHPKDRAQQDDISVATTDARDSGEVGGEAVKVSRRDPSSSTDDGKPPPTTRRRHRASSAFDPNDAAGIAALKAQLAAQDKEKDERERRIPTIKEPSPERRDHIDLPEADADVVSDVSSKGDSRGRELIIPDHDDKQVRVVSPPRDKDDKKPIKGILKQPKTQFPEETNPIREGVAPHKDDKTKANVPSGAKWTKISRKMVNPEALSIGKERFEIRDDFVIVLRVLNKEEIQAYAAATAQLRERRRKDHEKGQKDAAKEIEYEPDREESEDRKKHRQHRIEPQDDDRKERRRHRHEGEAEDHKPRGEYQASSGRHHRSHRERDREVVREDRRDREGHRERDVIYAEK